MPMHAMVSCYSTDQQMAVTCQDMLQSTNKSREEKDCKLVNMDPGFKIHKTDALQMFY